RLHLATPGPRGVFHTFGRKTAPTSAGIPYLGRTTSLDGHLLAGRRTGRHGACEIARPRPPVPTGLAPASDFVRRQPVRHCLALLSVPACPIRAPSARPRLPGRRPSELQAYRRVQEAVRVCPRRPSNRSHRLSAEALAAPGCGPTRLPGAMS